MPVNYKVTLKFDSGAPRPNTKKMVEDAAQKLVKHWEQSLASGQKPSGGSLPQNKEGRPMGIGYGSFLEFDQSKARKGKSKEGYPKHSITVQPGNHTDKRYIIAWRDLAKNHGFEGWSIEGQSEAVFEAAVQELLAEYIKEWNASAKTSKTQGE